MGSLLLGKREENAYHAGGLGKACFVVQKNAPRPAEDIVKKKNAKGGYSYRVSKTLAILAYLTLKAFIYKGIKSAKVVGGLEIHFGGLYNHYLEQILLEKETFS